MSSTDRFVIFLLLVALLAGVFLVIEIYKAR